MIKIKFFILLFLLLFSNAAFSNVDEINKINQQIESIDGLFKSGAMDQEEYDKIKTRLSLKKQKLENDSDTKTKKQSERSVTLNKQVEVLEKLLKDGVISKDEFEQSKAFLEDKENKGQNIDLDEILNANQKKIDYVFNYKKDKGKRNWEKTSIDFNNFKILPYRPGGIKIVRSSDNKKLFQITDNFKIKYFNGGEKYITTKKTVYDIGTAKNLEGLVNNAEEAIVESFKDIGRLLSDPFSKKKKKVWDKDAHKLELFIEGNKMLTFEGRYVKRHRAFFYQVLTPSHQPFHYYIKIASKKAIALNMEFFNVKIDRAIRKAKKRLSEEYNIAEEEIQKIIDKQITQELDKTLDKEIEKEMEKAINDSVAEAIEKSVGEAMSEGIMDAIEEATGEAISEAIEKELADHIDNEIERAIQDGIEAAAVEAGFQAYYDTLLQGGSVEEALKNASDACGAGCEFVLE